MTDKRTKLASIAIAISVAGCSTAGPLVPASSSDRGSAALVASKLVPGKSVKQAVLDNYKTNACVQQKLEAVLSDEDYFEQDDYLASYTAARAKYSSEKEANAAGAITAVPVRFNRGVHDATAECAAEYRAANPTPSATPTAVSATPTPTSTPIIIPSALPTVSITINTFGFTTNRKISVGQTVTWTNLTSKVHTIEAGDGSFSSGELQTGNTFSRKFETPGIVAYKCGKHSGEVSKIEVR